MNIAYGELARINFSVVELDAVVKLQVKEPVRPDTAYVSRCAKDRRVRSGEAKQDLGGFKACAL